MRKVDEGRTGGRGVVDGWVLEGELGRSESELEVRRGLRFRVTCFERRKREGFRRDRKAER